MTLSQAIVLPCGSSEWKIRSEAAHGRHPEQVSADEGPGDYRGRGKGRGCPKQVVLSGCLSIADLYMDSF